jgi:hypothetical protein
MERARQAEVPAGAKIEITNNITTNLDGKGVTKRQVQLATMPKSISGGPDSFGSYIGPGTTVYGV